MSTRRALHFVLKIGNRKKNIDFFKNILGMRVLRHEEFEKGCEAACNGPYDGKWSKTMIGYGDEKDHFVIELTYNYGIKHYAVGNDFLGLSINLDDIKSRISESNYPYVKQDDGAIELLSPDGYKFRVHPINSTGDPVSMVSLGVSNLQTSKEYWNNLLGMNLLSESSDMITMDYGNDQCKLRLVQSSEKIDHAEAFGRIAFACPGKELKPLEKKMNENLKTILTPYISLDTPGKATVEVVILADPDGHEICFVGEEGFSALSKVDPKGDDLLTKAIEADRSDEWFEKRKQREERMK
ncbi:glyoxalase domain-containing protein 4-like [Hydractinia symbiolongicarpus]|uniref:glyoxalase domain-containing protein 4-like n=1 Tax=Hydractinia symbiolongicarpus TaxID=13093 RepID=UPI00254A5BE0|nr:glyoxalase domain-containing protein 4-like [Hydractinia symbiolongicarpus]